MFDAWNLGVRALPLKCLGTQQDLASACKVTNLCSQVILGSKIPHMTGDIMNENALRDSCSCNFITKELCVIICATTVATHFKVIIERKAACGSKAFETSLFCIL